MDAPNLHLITEWNAEPVKTDYYGLPKAGINEDLGKIPLDSLAVKAINNGQTIVDIDSTSGAAVNRIYHKTM